MTVDFIFDDMKDENLVMIPFSDGNIAGILICSPGTGTQINPDIQIFHDHVMKWISKVQKNPGLR